MHDPKSERKYVPESKEVYVRFIDKFCVLTSRFIHLELLLSDDTNSFSGEIQDDSWTFLWTGIKNDLTTTRPSMLHRECESPEPPSSLAIACSLFHDVM